MTFTEWMSKTRTRRSILRFIRRYFLGWVELRVYSEPPPEDENKTFENQYGEVDFKPYDCYIQRILIPKKDLPPHATHCSGESGVYNLDMIHVRYPYHDNGFSATDGWHWSKYDGYEESLSPKWTAMDHVNMKTVLIIGGVIIGVMLLIFFLKG